MGSLQSDEGGPVRSPRGRNHLCRHVCQLGPLRGEGILSDSTLLRIELEDDGLSMNLVLYTGGERTVQFSGHVAARIRTGWNMTEAIDDILIVDASQFLDETLKNLHELEEPTEGLHCYQAVMSDGTVLLEVIARAATVGDHR